MTISRRECERLDQQDPLSSVRQKFLLPEDVVFMGGNSLGALSLPAVEAVDKLVRDQWGNGLLRSWNTAGWIDAPRRLGDKIGEIIGARAGQVVVADSTSVDLYKLLAGALHSRPSRRRILSEEANFPTDLYVAQGVASNFGAELVTVPRHEVADAIDDSVGIVMLTHVDYASAHMLDMTAATDAVHAAGALMLWDLSHSAGAVPVDLDRCDVDLAVGCGYKYLNGGPGAPGYLYVAERLQHEMESPIWGWMGDASPFAFKPTYTPGTGIDRFLAGTPPMLSMAALEAAVDLWLEVDRDEVWKKSRAMSELMIALVDADAAAHGVSIASPRDPLLRGSHLSMCHPHAYPLMRALIGRGVIGDFRPPDMMRFSITPLYHRYTDMWDAMHTLVGILTSRAYQEPEYQQRLKVT